PMRFDQARTVPMVTWSVNHPERKIKPAIFRISREAFATSWNCGWIRSASLLNWLARRRRSHRSTIGQPSERRPGICSRVGQDRLVIRNPMLDGVWRKQFVLIPACATNPRWDLLEGHPQPSAIDRHGNRLPFPMAKRADRHIWQLDRSANRNLEDEIDLNERCWIQTLFFR